MDPVLNQSDEVSPVVAVAVSNTANKTWVSTLTHKESTALIATFAGWMLDGMDVMVFSFVVPTLIIVWHLTRTQVGYLGTSALLISSVGGWLAGLAADRFGRVKVLQLTIIWFAFFTFLSGFTNSVGQLFVVRGLQGLGFGGEWAVGSVLIGETIRAEHRGKAVGMVQGGWSIGWAIAALCYTLFFTVFPQQIAWRAMFWIGILPALLVFYIRREVSESDTYTAKASAPESVKTSLWEIFTGRIFRNTLFASLVSLGAQGGYYAINTWLPLYLKRERNLSVLDTGGYLLVVITGSFVGYMTSAYLTDYIGRKKTLILFAVLSFATIWCYTSLPISNSVMLVLGFPLGFFPSGSFSPMGSFFTELFPTRLRGSAQGFCYNIGRGVGALFPTFVGVMNTRISLGHSIEIFSMLAYFVMAASVLALPETRGRLLQE